MSMYAMIELSDSGIQDLPKEMVSQGGEVYGQNLGQCDGIEELDAIAIAASATPLSDFLDDSDMLDDDEREEYGLPPAEPKWAEIADGIATLQSLILELEQRPGDSPLGRYTAEAVLWDLRASLAILETHSESDEDFRFNIG